MPSPKKPVASAQNRAITSFEEKFAKTFGAGTLTRTEAINPYEVISTGSLAIDFALGVGGLLEGRLHEIWGPEGIGKSTIALMHIACAQEKHPTKMAAYVDVEQKMDERWAAKHGVDLSRLYIYRPNNAEDVADAVKEFVSSGLVSIVVIDSIGAMIPEAEKAKDAGAAVMAAQAKIVTRMVKIAAAEAPKTGTEIFIVNQVRANLSYGADTTTGGGFALRHATTTKMKMRRTGTEAFKTKVNGEDVVVGHELAITIERNGVAPAYRTAVIVMFNQDTEKYGPVGIDRADEAVTMGLKTHTIKQRGSWYDTPDGHNYNGRAALVDAVRGDLTLQDQIRTRVLAIAAGTILMEETAPEEIPEEEVDPMEALKAKVEKGTTGKFRTSGSIAAADS